MNLIIIILAALALPAVLLTLYSKNEKGVNLPLGSFYIMKKFSTKVFKVRSFREYTLLALRLAVLLLIAILIFDPSDVEEPGRDFIAHMPGKAGQSRSQDGTLLKLDAPQKSLDAYNEDLFFLETFIRNYPPLHKEVRVIYAPTREKLEGSTGDIIVFPGPDQEKDAFNLWASKLYMADVKNLKTEIKDRGVNIRRYYQLVRVDTDDVTAHLTLQNGAIIAAAFRDKDRRVLIFGVGLSTAWGDLGVSAIFIDVIEHFINSAPLEIKKKTGDDTPEQLSADVNSLLDQELILMIAALFLLFELIFFVFKSSRSALIIVFAFFIAVPGSAWAEDFKFIELDVGGGGQSRAMFRIVKEVLEQRTTIKIAPDFYKRYPAHFLLQGKLPEYPYLWIMGCRGTGAMSDRLVQALRKFVQRGGIIFVDTCGMPDDSAFFSFFNRVGLSLSEGRGLIKPLSRDHPIYRSFYLLSSENFTGMNVSISTGRTALIISRKNLRSRLLRRDEMAMRAAVNIVLYMLSGNYKSDQIHTRQILKRLKKRELYR